MKKILLATLAFLWLLAGLGGRLVAQENIAVWQFPLMQETSDPVSPSCVSDLIQSTDCELTVATDGWTFRATDYNNTNTVLCGDETNATTSKGLRLTNTNGNFTEASIVFKISTAAYGSIMLNYDHRIAATGGYETETWSYSTNGVSFTEVTSITGATTTYATEQVDFSSVSALNGLQSVWFKLTVSGATVDNAVTAIDNVVFTGSPMTCLKPDMTAVADDAPTEAVVSWTPAGDNEESYTLVYHTSQLNATALNALVSNSSSNVVANATSPYTLTGLTANTTYYIYVRANCGDDDNSLWANATVTTPAVCAISGLAASSIMGSTASLSWTTEAANTMVRVFSAATANPWEATENLVFDQIVSGTSCDLTGLSFSTTYYVYAKAVCSANNMSETSNISFTTSFADGIITIGDASDANSYLPTYCLYNYSLTEQIYTAAEIGTTGTIESISFYNNNGAQTRTIDLYMLTTDKETFASATDWVAVSSSNLVFSGSVTFAQGAWTTITLTNSFNYLGGDNNLLIAVDDNTGSWVSSMSFNAFAATNQSMYVYSDDTNYNPESPSSYSATRPAVKNQILLEITPFSSCPRPSGLVANNLTASAATITWVAGGEETAWVLKYGPAGFNVETAGTEVSVETTPSYDLTGLTAATSYDVYVKAVCGENNESSWKQMTFNTSICNPEDMCEIHYSLTDSYGDGWNGNAINVIDVALNEVLATWTMSSGSSAAGSLAICDGREIRFEYVTGSYPDETSYVVTDASGATIFSGSDVLSPVSYTMSCPDCMLVTNLTVSSITATTASVSWVSGNSAWQYQLNEDEVFTVNERPVELTGLTANTQYTIKIRAICGEDEYSEWAIQTFSTACEAIVTFPWTETFESLTTPEMPSCWTVIDANNDGDYWKTFTDYGNPGISVGLYTDYNNGSNNDYLILPAFELNGSYVFSYDVRARSTSEPNDYRVLLSTTGNSPEDFTVVLKELETVDYTTYQTKDINLNGYNGMVYIAIHVPQGGLDGYYIYFDNFKIRETSSAAEITAFSFAEDAEVAVIDSENARVTSVVSYQTESLNGLVPTIAISDYATIAPASGVAQDFTGPVTYTVTAEDGTTTKEWTVNVSKVETASSAKDILSFTFSGQSREADINPENHTVLAYAAWNYDFANNITPTITVSPQATIYPVSDSAINFATPVTYTVTAEDESTQEWTVTIINDPNACPNPAAVVANPITTSGATLTWEQRYLETSYLVKVSSTAMTDMTATADVFDDEVNAMTLDLTGLTENTTYYVYVQSACENATGWTNTTFYTGMCVPAPTSVDGSGITNVTFGTGANVVNNNTHPTSSPYYGNYTAQVGAVQASETATISIRYATGYTYGTVVWVNWNNDVLFTSDEIVAFGTSTSNNPTTLELSFEVPVNTPVGNYRMRIGGADSQFDSESGRTPCKNTSYTIYEDYTLQVLAPPTCMRVNEIEVANTTTNSAEITWTLNDDAQDAWQVVVSATALDDPATATMNDVTAATFNATGLTANTPYYVYVRANCADDDQSDWVSSQFRTECGDMAVPFTETFTDYTATTYSAAGVMADCWSYIYNGTNTAYAPHVSNSTSYAPMSGADVNYLFAIASNNTNMATYGNDNIVMLPPVEGGYASRTVSFAARTSSSTNAAVKLGYMNGNSFVNLTDVAFATATISFSYVVPNTVPEGAKLALKFSVLASASSTVYYGIDNVVVRETSTDNTILSYAASTAQGDAICAVDNDAHTISVELRAGATAPVVIGQTIVLNDANATIQQQFADNFITPPNYFQWFMTTADTTVIYKVTAENGAEQLYNANITVESCAAPSALVAEQTSLTNVNCSWTPGEGTTAWNFYCSTTQMTPAGLDALTASDYTTVTTASASATVVGETTYYWYVRTDCSGSYSAWLEGTFTTWENCVAPTNLATEVVNDNNIVVSWNVQDNLPLGETFGIGTDSFERDQINDGSLTYTNGAIPWSIVLAGAHSGSKCLVSASGNNSATSQIDITIDYSEPFEFSFWYKVSSESGYDYFYFYLDGEQILSKSGTVAWTQYTTTLSAGSHTLSWRYTKDSGVASGSDCAWIDDVVLPMNMVLPGGNSSVVVYRNDIELATVPATQTSYTDEGLEAGNYCYKVKTICREGSESEFSAPVCQDINACLAVTNMSATNVTATSATISWTRGDEVAWNLTVNGGSPVALTETDVTVDANVITYALAGLEPMTDYTVTIQSDCGGSVSQSVASVDFTTDRVPATLPYTCDFENAVENNGWVLLNGTQTNTWYIGTAANNGGANGLYITNDNGTSNAYDNASTSYVYAYRTINVENASDYIVSFNWKAYAESCCDYIRAFLVPADITINANEANGIGTTGAPTNWIAIDGGNKLNYISSWQAVSNVISLENAGNYNLVFYWKNDYSGGTQPPAAIDNIDIHALTCPSVGDLAVAPANITDNSAVIAWTERGTAEAWEVIVSATEVTDLASATAVPVTEPSYTATGLEAETLYHVYVRANCGTDDNSQWAHATFTTVASCPVPDGLASSTSLANLTTITWNGYTASNWTFEYQLGTADDWTVVENLDAATYTITTTPTTTYNVRVKAVCGVDEESAYSTIFSFTTPCGAITEFPWNEGFENGIDCWTLVDADGDGEEWYQANVTGGDASLGNHGGSYIMTSASYNSGALTPNNWLISPALDLSALSGTVKMSYFVGGQDMAWYEEHYKVCVSTTTTDVASFSTVLLEETLPSEGWLERNVDLSAYVGQTIYVAFVHYDCTDMFRLDLDDISVYVDNSTDAAITGITAPTHGDYSTCALTDAEQIKVNIINNGGAAISDFEVSYSINGGAAVTETVTASIAPAQTYEYTFAQTADLSAVGTYTINASVNLTGDETADNNSASMTITSGDATIRIHALTDNGGGQSWSVTNTITNEVVAERTLAWQWNIEVNEYVCVDATQCYSVVVNDANGMSSPAYVEILYNGEQVAGSTEGGSFTGPSLVAERFTPECDVYTINASVNGDFGSIEPSGLVVVTNGDSQTFTMTPWDGFALSSLMVDGVDQLSQVVNNTYTFENVSANHTIVATFDAAIVITATAGNGGSIDPSGAVLVGAGANYTFTVTADEGYTISSVLVDGTDEQIAEGSMLTSFNYTFSNVTEDHTIAASFVSAQPHTITATASAGGSISPSGQVSVPYNGTQAFELIPDEGYSLSGLTVDNVNAMSQVENNTYTFTNVIEDHTINANFAVNNYNLTVHYVYADNTTAAPDHTESFAFGAEYSVESPVIAGYTADQLTVAGTMPAQDVDVTVTYNVNSYTLTIHYVYADQTVARPDYTAQVAYGAEYSVESPVVECYTADQLTVAGTMPAQDVEVNVIYNVDTYTLTVHYVYADNTEAATTYTETVACGETYSVPSPVIDGYTADPAVVEGTMPANDVDVTVTYNEIVTHTLTIHYVYAETNAQAAADHTETLAEGAAYSVTSPVIDGYTASQTVVEGTMGTSDIEVTVRYTSNTVPTYTLTIHYVYAETNAQAAADHTETLAEGAAYSVTSPVIDGYTADQTIVAGTMPAQNVEVTVRYTANTATTYTITATAGNGGAINPNGTVTVNEGADQPFTITADAGYRIESVLVDGADAISELVNNVYTFVNVTSNHTIAVTFAPVSSTTYTIIATAGSNGTITPNGVITVAEGATQTFRFAPNEGYRIASVMVDNVEAITDVVDNEYVFYNVTANHTINVTFTDGNAVDEYTTASMSVYPNPNNGMFSIDFSRIEGDATYQLIDARGAVVETRDINVMDGDTMNFNHDLRPGTYFVRIVTADKVYVEQIVVE